MFTELLTTTNWLESDESIGDDDADDSTIWRRVDVLTWRFNFEVSFSHADLDEAVEGCNNRTPLNTIELLDLSNVLGERNQVNNSSSLTGNNLTDLT